MPVQMVHSNPRVRENLGKAAIMRGPIVYCLEEEDNGPNLQQIKLPQEPRFSYQYEKDLLGGIVVIKSDGWILDSQSWNSDSLYDFYAKETYTEKALTWIPYYAWANRNCGEMQVWTKTE